MSEPFSYNGIIYGGEELSFEDGYITMMDFPIPVILSEAKVCIVRDNVYIPIANFNIPNFSSQEEFNRYMEGEGKDILLPLILELSRRYATSEIGKSAAKSQLGRIFGF